MGEPNDTAAGSNRDRVPPAGWWWVPVYVAALWAGIRLAYLVDLDEGKLTVIWVPTGLVVGGLLVTRRQLWPALLALSTGVYVADGLIWPDLGWSWYQLLIVAVVTDLLRAVAAWVLVGVSPRRVRLEHPADLVRLIAVVLGVFFLSAAISVRMWSAWEPELDFWREVQLWWFSEALGAVVLVPWVLAYFGPASAESSPVRRARYAEAAAVLGLLALISLAFFRLADEAGPVVQQPYLVYPLLIWSGLRLGLRFNTTALLWLTVLLTMVLAGDVGPFVKGQGGPSSPRAAVVSLQLFLLVTVFSVLLLTVIRERGLRTEALRRANHEQFRALAGTLKPTLWLMDLPGKELTYISPAFKALTGRDPASMLGRPGAWRDLVHPDDRALTDASLARMIEHGHDDTEYRIVRTDRAVRWVRELTAAVPNEGGQPRQLAGSVEDVTHRRRAAEQRDILETELREANTRYRDFMRISGEAVWRAELGEPVPLDLPFEVFFERCLAHGWIAECNDAFARMYGYARPQDAVGTGLLDNFRLRDEHNLAYIRRFHAAGCRSLSTESRRPMPDGDVRWTIATFTGVVEDGHLLRLWGTITDTTAQRRLEDQVREAQRLEAVGQLAAGVAHDFNNLLAVISAHTELVEGRVAADEQVAQSLSAVHEAVDHASGVSRSLMAFGQKTPARLDPVDLTAVIERTRRMVSRSLPAGVTLSLELPEAGLPDVTGDAVQLQQALLNLVLNARDAMPDSGGRIAIAAEVDPQTPGTVVRLAVQDDGRGMDETVRRRVFDPFFTTRRDAGGTGLGLAVVHGIVRDHGGQIAVSSRPGRGTTVTIELPAARDGGPGPRVEGSAHGEEPAENDAERSASVLLAEDDPQVRAVLASALEARGYRVFPVAAAADLRRVYDEQDRLGSPIELVVTDVQMPGGSGLDAVRALRAAGHDTPAVVVSGSGAVEIDPEAHGRTVLLTKPFALQTLCDVVREQLATPGE